MIPRLTWIALTALSLGAVVLPGCTLMREPTHISTVRTADTVTVLLDEATNARWAPERDSLVVECATCEEGQSQAVEHFWRRNYSQFEIASRETLKLSLYTRGHLDTTIILEGIPDSTSVNNKSTLRAYPEYPRRHAEHVKPETPETTKTVEKKTEKKAATSLRVSAAEGVAVYKDKSKKEVLKILPKGSILPLLGKEGDMYSVNIDGIEGFVEAEAVQEVQ